MERKQKISEFRKKMDQTLAHHGLANKESIRKLVQNQLHSSPSDFQEKRIADLSNLLDILRSASGNDFKASNNYGASHGAWKLKQDNEHYRVMYREGPQGSPFHTLLAEGYADAPLDACLCAGWEVSMYKNWWPEIKFPPFKVMTSCCLKKARIDEQITLLRMKVPWPLSDREMIVDYFVMEYLKDGLVIVLLNSISDTESLDKLMQGSFDDEIPKAKDTVRMDLKLGGFALKMITSNISYFRTVGHIDMKVELAPPSLINFISRQILGDACKLFQKTAVSVAKGDGDFGKALETPLYVRLREHLYLNNTPGPKALPSENSELHNGHVEISK